MPDGKAATVFVIGSTRHYRVQIATHDRTAGSRDAVDQLLVALAAALSPRGDLFVEFDATYWDEQLNGWTGVLFVPLAQEDGALCKLRALRLAQLARQRLRTRGFELLAEAPARERVRLDRSLPVAPPPLRFAPDAITLLEQQPLLDAGDDPIEVQEPAPEPVPAPAPPPAPSPAPAPVRHSTPPPASARVETESAEPARPGKGAYVVFDDDAQVLVEYADQADALRAMRTIETATGVAARANGSLLGWRAPMSGSSALAQARAAKAARRLVLRWAYEKRWKTPRPGG